MRRHSASASTKVFTLAVRAMADDSADKSKIRNPESAYRLFSDFRSQVSLLRPGFAGQAGYTLVELMTVIAIIAVLAGLILGVAGYVTRKADESRATADMEKIKNALEEYRVAYGSYPTNTVANNSSNWVSALWRERQFLVLKGWNNTTVVYRAVDPWGNDYRYYYDADGNPVYATNNNSKFGYDLWSEGPNMTNTSDNINNWSGPRF